MSPNLAKSLQARKRSVALSGCLTNHTNHTNHTSLRYHATQSNHTLEFLAKLAKPSYDAKVFASNANDGSIR